MHMLYVISSHFEIISISHVKQYLRLHLEIVQYTKLSLKSKISGSLPVQGRILINLSEILKCNIRSTYH